MKRVCLGPEPGVRCPTSALVTGVRCPSCSMHQRADHSRIYGGTHQAIRRQLAQTLPRYCAYGCGTLLQPGSRWVAAHVVDRQPEHGWMVSCVSCNEQHKGFRAVKSSEGSRARMTHAPFRTLTGD